MDSNKTEPIPPGAASCPACLTCYLDSTHAAECCPGARRCEECTEGPEHSVEDCPHAQPCKTCSGAGYTALEDDESNGLAVLTECDECEAMDIRHKSERLAAILGSADLLHKDLKGGPFLAHARRCALSLAVGVVIPHNPETVQPDALRELVSASRWLTSFDFTPGSLTDRYARAVLAFEGMEV